MEDLKLSRDKTSTKRENLEKELSQLESRAKEILAKIEEAKRTPEGSKKNGGDFDIDSLKAEESEKKREKLTELEEWIEKVESSLSSLKNGDITPEEFKGVVNGGSFKIKNKETSQRKELKEKPASSDTLTGDLKVDKVKEKINNEEEEATSENENTQTDKNLNRSKNIEKDSNEKGKPKTKKERKIIEFKDYTAETDKSPNRAKKREFFNAFEDRFGEKVLLEHEIMELLAERKITVEDFVNWSEKYLNLSLNKEFSKRELIEKFKQNIEIINETDDREVFNGASRHFKFELERLILSKK